MQETQASLFILLLKNIMTYQYNVVMQKSILRALLCIYQLHKESLLRKGMSLEKIFVKTDSICNRFEVNWPDLQRMFLTMCQILIMLQVGEEFLCVHRGHRVSGQRSALLKRGLLWHGMQFINYPLPYNCGDKSV